MQGFLSRVFFNTRTESSVVSAQVLLYFRGETPHDGERVATFAGADESGLFHRLDCIAIGRQRAYFFVIFRPPQDWVAA